MKTNNTRRSFITKSIAGITGAVAASAIPMSAYAEETNSDITSIDESHTFLTKPYLQAPSINGMTIMWLTNLKCLNWVEFGETEKLGTKAQQVTNGLLNTHSKINCVSLTGLKPNTKYFYKVFSKQIVEFQPYKMTFGEVISSDIYSFTTLNPNAEKVSWLVLNDIHDRPKSFEELLKINKDKPYDYVFLNGDIFNYQKDEKQIVDHLLNPCSIFSTEKPFLYVRGNHETRGEFSRNLYDYYYNYDNREYYSYKMGPVFTIVLDTGEDKEDTAPVYGGAVDFDKYREEQALWLEEQMKSKAFKKAPFRVVMMHIPHFYTNEEGHGALECRRLFAPLFEKYKIDLFIAGHTHKYKLQGPNEKHSYHIAIGGGPTTGKRTLTRIEADSKKLNLTMFKDDGTEFGQFNLDSKR